MNDPFSRMPNFGSGGDLGTSGTAWANAAAKASGGKSYSQLQSDLQAAEQSGDPAKLAAANAAIQRYDNFAQMLSDAEKKRNDTIASISRNLN
jgi:beta-glucanase (GH16 family)